MRIALFSRSLPAHGLGGMEIHAAQVAEGLAARGHEVVAYTTRLAAGPGEDARPGLRIRYLAGTWPRSYLGGRWGGYWRVSRAACLTDHARAPFDAAYSESAGAFGLLAQPGPPVPVVAFLVGTAGAELRSKLRQPLRPRTLLGIGWNAAAHLLSRRHLPRAARILCESEGLREWALREMPLDPARVEAAWLGADTARFAPEGRVLPELERAASGATRVVFGGRLEREKGFDVALRALAAVLPERPGTAAVLVGEGREKARLLALARPLAAAGRFAWLPPVAHARLPELYRGAAIYLMPTRREEGSALSLVEAMASGAALVVSRIGGLPGLLREGEDAILVPPGEVEPLAAAVAQLLDEPALRARLGAAARATACARFSLDGMLDRIEAALGAAAAEARR